MFNHHALVASSSHTHYNPVGDKPKAQPARPELYVFVSTSMMPIPNAREWHFESSNQHPTMEMETKLRMAHCPSHIHRCRQAYSSRRGGTCPPQDLEMGNLNRKPYHEGCSLSLPVNSVFYVASARWTCERLATFTQHFVRVERLCRIDSLTKTSVHHVVLLALACAKGTRDILAWPR